MNRWTADGQGIDDFPNTRTCASVRPGPGPDDEVPSWESGMVWREASGAKTGDWRALAQCVSA